jgi:GAF domain-containing protein
MINSKLNDEPGRLAALNRYRFDAHGPDSTLQKIVDLVKSALGVPICAIMMIGKEQAWIPASAGMAPSPCPRGNTLCNATIQGDEPMVVPDARMDPRFATTSLVAGEPGVVGYAGIPLTTTDGYNVGALCAIDTHPRAFTQTEVQILREFAALICGEMELSRRACDARDVGIFDPKRSLQPA